MAYRRHQASLRPRLRTVNVAGRRGTNIGPICVLRGKPARARGWGSSSAGLRATASKDPSGVYEALAVEGAKGNERASRVWKGDGCDSSRESLELSS